MNGYDYFEFLAVERPLSQRDQRELLTLAPRATVTPTRFCTGYGVGALTADPQLLMARHFDVMVHTSSGGARELMLRLPRAQADVDLLRRYLRGDAASFDTIGEAVILDLCSEASDPDDWADGDGWMAALAPVREELLRGDTRALYLAWLSSAQCGDLPDDALEPAVPRGLRERTGAELELASFLRIDEELVTAAAEQSPALRRDPAEVREWVCQLPPAQKDALLVEAIAGTPERLAADLHRRFESAAAPGATPRTVGALCELAGERRNERERAEALRRQRRQSATLHGRAPR